MRLLLLALCLAAACALLALPARPPLRCCRGLPQCYAAQGLPTLEVSMSHSWPGVYNPSLWLGSRGSCWLAARRSLSRDAQSDLLIARGSFARLAQEPLLVHPEFAGLIDARAFEFQGKAFACAHRVGAEGEPVMCLLCAEPGLQSFADLTCESCPAGLPEKNWMPLPQMDALYWVHTLSPFRLLRTQPFELPLRAPLSCAPVPRPSHFKQARASARGSSAACALPGSQLMLLATHRRLSGSSLSGIGAVQEPPVYTQALVLLRARPPFEVLAETAPFALRGADAPTSVALGRGFHFVNGLCCRGQDVIFSVGVADTLALLLVARLPAVMALLHAL